MQSPSRVASVAAGLGVAGVVVSILGPLGAWLGVVAPLLGFYALLLGMLCALLAILVGLVGLWSTRASSGRSGRGRALIGVGLGVLLVLAVGGSRPDTDSRADFNDITTDMADPPVFSHAQTLEANRGRDLAYPTEFSPKQQELYADVVPIAFGGSAADAYRSAESAAKQLNWELTFGDGSGQIEATDTSSIFHFVDDIVIRIRPADGGGATIDVRSKSRDGRSDLGVNAKRIRAFRDALSPS